MSDLTSRIVEFSTDHVDVGFGDLSHFNRSFRRHYGTTPREVRGDGGRDMPGGCLADEGVR
ncbi:helix-turn-helix domain-containing protein [Bradyrhizobium sp. USDA 4353]